MRQNELILSQKIVASPWRTICRRGAQNVTRSSPTSWHVSAIRARKQNTRIPERHAFCRGSSGDPPDRIRDADAFSDPVVVPGTKPVAFARSSRVYEGDSHASGIFEHFKCHLASTRSPPMGMRPYKNGFPRDEHYSTMRRVRIRNALQFMI